MKYVVGDLYQPDLAILPIGGVFTMGPEEATHACGLIQPTVVIPEYYATFPVLEPNANGFVSLLEKSHPLIKVLPIQPGENALV